MPAQKLTYKKSDNFTMFCPSFIDDYGFTPEEFRIFARIMRRCLGENSEGFFESIPQIAEKLQIGRDSVRRSLQLLVKCNAVTRESRPGKSDIYQFNSCDKWVPSEKLPSIRREIEGEIEVPTPTKNSSTTEISRGTKNSRGVIRKPVGVPLLKTVYEGISPEGNPTKETQEACVRELSYEPEESDLPNNARFIPKWPERKLQGVIQARDGTSPDWPEYLEALEDWWCEVNNIVSLPPNVDSSEQAMWLFENNFTLEDVKGFYEFAATDPEQKKWRRGNITLGAIVKGIAAWKKEQKAVAEVKEFVPKRCDDCRELDGFVIVKVGGVTRMAKCRHAGERKAA